MKARNQNGFSTLEALTILLVIVVLGGVGYFVWHEHGTSSEKSTSKTVATTHKPASTTKNTHTGFLDITEWGIKIALNDAAITDATYTAPKTVVSGVESVDLATKNTQSMDFVCGDAGLTTEEHMQSDDQDVLYRSNVASSLAEYVQVPESSYTHIGGYYYAYQPNTGHGNCRIANNDLATQAAAASKAFTKASILSE